MSEERKDRLEQGVLAFETSEPVATMDSMEALLDESEKIDRDTQEKLLNQYDSESNTRQLGPAAGKIVFVLSLVLGVFTIYTAGFGLLDSLYQRAVHLFFVFPLVFLLYPSSKKNKLKKPGALDYALAVAGMVAAGYLVVNYRPILLRVGLAIEQDVYIFLLTVVLLFEGVRRAIGKELVILSSIFLAYAYFGTYMPGIFQHRGASLLRLTSHLLLIPEGIYGTALGTCATYIILFVIYATFLEKSGMGQLIQDLALAVAGSVAGGPAKVAVFTSALFGTINGSAVANVVTTGTFTIPLMKRIGYPKEFAAAVEAVSSTAGQLMPPIMGSAAFIMADYTGIPYGTICIAAVVPVMLYYVGVFTMVHMRAKKIGLVGLSKHQMPKLMEVLKTRGHLVLPLIFVVMLLLLRYTPLFVGFWGIVVTVLCAALRKKTRMSVKDIVWAIETGARRSVSVSISGAVIGIIIGVCTLTGLTNIISSYILSLSENSLLITLLLVMVIALIMGMGLPTVAVYMLLATVAVPILRAFSIPMLAAHFYVFYFGLMANVTPPVAIPAYCAAGLANANPSKVGWIAFRLALAGFLVPFMFIYAPDLLFIDATFAVIPKIITATLGVFLMGCSLENYFLGLLLPWQRWLMGVASIGLVIPEQITDVIGLVVFVVILYTQIRRNKLKISRHL